METQQLMNLLHLSGAALACLAVFSRVLTLFKGVQGNLPNPAGRKAFVALQHLSMTLLAATGIALLVMKNFEVQPWFYAKIILFAALLSALSKAYRKEGGIALNQRRAGLFLAAVALSAIFGLVLIQPDFG